MKNFVLKRSQTIFLRLVIIFMALVGTAVALVAIPLDIARHSINQPFVPYWIILSLTVIPFHIALYNGFKLLGYIDNKTAFSQNSVSAFKKIKTSATVIVLMYLACYPFIYQVADSEDAPGVILIWLVICGIPMSVAVFAGVLQKLFQSMIEIKSENDLTV